jgi:protein-disulfide isomerase/uncharacterized membrane protein
MILLKSKNREVKPLPFAVYFWTVAGLALAGLTNAIYLSISHYRVYTDPAYESFCAISKAVNCDTVSQSPYSIFLGVPVPVWGVIGFAFILFFLPFAVDRSAGRKRMWSVLFLILFGYSIYSIILAAISSVIIHSYCVMCLLSFAITFLLTYFTWLIRSRFDPAGGLMAGVRADVQFFMQRRGQTAGIVGLFSAGLILTVAFFPVYWSFQPAEVTTRVPSGVTADGHPWIGNPDAEIVIIEYTDYMCFQCNKTHYYLRKLMASYPGKLKIVHRHFPMDHKVNPLVEVPVHHGSGALAMLAIYAQTQGKFWEMNDYLFANAREVEQIDLRSAAAAAGLDARRLAAALSDPSIRSKLRRDILSGLKTGVRGTPTFSINESLYSGQLPMAVLNHIVEK